MERPMRALIFILLATCSCARLVDTGAIIAEQIIEKKVEDYTGLDIDIDLNGDGK